MVEPQGELRLSFQLQRWLSKDIEPKETFFKAKRKELNEKHSTTTDKGSKIKRINRINLILNSLHSQRKSKLAKSNRWYSLLPYQFLQYSSPTLQTSFLINNPLYFSQVSSFILHHSTISNVPFSDRLSKHDFSITMFHTDIQIILLNIITQSLKLLYNKANNIRIMTTIWS